MRLIIEALENPKSQSTYAAMTAFHQEVESQVSERLGEGDEETAAWGNVEETANVETKILEPGTALPHWWERPRTGPEARNVGQSRILFVQRGKVRWKLV